MDRLGQQIRFIVEIDKLKQVFRQSALIGDRRKEKITFYLRSLLTEC